MRVETEIVEMLKKKYGQENLRKVIQYYGSGLPEREWMTSPEPGNMNAIDVVINGVMEKTNMAIIGSGKKVTHVITQAMKIFIKGNMNVKQFEFLSFVEIIQGKYHQVNLEIIKDTSQFDVVSIINIKYGSIYKKVDGIFSPIIGSMTNTVLQKSVLLGIDFTEDINTESGMKMFEDKYGELVEVLNENFSLIWIK